MDDEGGWGNCEEAALKEMFRRFATATANGVGSPWAFIAGLVIIVGWAVMGPFFHFSDTWQLVVNTGTTIITFLMVFLIQHSQNRDGRAIQMKLDELIRSVKGARNKLIELEDCSDEEVATLRAEFAKLRAQATEKGKKVTERKVTVVEIEEKRE